MAAPARTGDLTPDPVAPLTLDGPAAGPATALRVALVGNPNTGKSTLFNALTGLRQRVGNYAGVTVERVEGSYRRDDGRRVTVLDLPGTYSLTATSPDEEIALTVLLGRAEEEPAPDVVVVVVDALNLERNLYLASQVIELGLPTIVALNQMDAAEAAGLRIDVPALIGELGVTVVPTVAIRGRGIDHLRRVIDVAPTLPRGGRAFAVPAELAAAIAPLERALESAEFAPAAAAMQALRLLAVATPEAHLARLPGIHDAIERSRAEVTRVGRDPRSLEAELRYGWIDELIGRVLTRPGGASRTPSDRIDAVLLHRIWGPLIFVVLMALIFQSIFTWATPVMDAVDGALSSLGARVGSALPPGDLRGLLVDGVIAGVGSVLVFLPQITILFALIGILEDTGYMARAAFIMDRFMRGVGLHGRSFIPMLSGYACAVPGIMSTRTIDHPKDRLATILVLPLMSCSARIPVYTLLIGAFVPSVAVLGLFDLRGITLLVMYLLGTVTALLMAAVFKRTLLRGPVRPMIMELPPYRLPSPRGLVLSVWHRVRLFLRKAGTIILALTVVLWAMASFPKVDIPAGTPPEVASEAQLAGSALGYVGKAIEPVVRPLGYDWKIGVSIAASFAAREVFVTTMGTIYGVGGADGQEASLRDRLRAERNPATGKPVYTPLVAVGLMVFYVYALMCISTLAVTVREAGGGRTGARWAALQFGYTLALAYGAAWLVYQGGRALGFAG